MDLMVNATQDVQYLGVIKNPSSLHPQEALVFPSKINSTKFLLALDKQDAHGAKEGQMGVKLLPKYGSRVTSRIDELISQPVGWYLFHKYAIENYIQCANNIDSCPSRHASNVSSLSSKASSNFNQEVKESHTRKPSVLTSNDISNNGTNNENSELFQHARKTLMQLRFLEKVALYRSEEDLNRRVKLAKRIWKDYCIDGARGGLADFEPTISNKKRQRAALFNARALVQHIGYTGLDLKSVHAECSDVSKLLGIGGATWTKLEQDMSLLHDRLSSLGTASFDAYKSRKELAPAFLTLDVFDRFAALVIHDLQITEMAKFQLTPFYDTYLSVIYLQHVPAQFKDFEPLRLLGRGGFGMVQACLKKKTGKLFAMKMMSKRLIKKKRAEKFVLYEHQILTKLCSPFVVGLKYAFQTSSDMYLLFDLLTGGDLLYHLTKQKRFHEEYVCFLGAQILLGIEHLHKNNIVYRDLKPENLLLDAEGNCCIVDLGLAQEMTPTLTGCSGTPGYWAPEMIKRDENGRRLHYGFCVDWWSFGCVLYEFLYGKCPFRTSKARSYHEDRDKSYDIATLEMEPDYDSKIFSPEAKQVVQALLNKDPVHRLGARGANEIKAAPFFRKVNWVKLASMKIIPPYCPQNNDVNADSQAEIGSFDPTDVQGIELTEKDQSQYKSWNFVSSDAFQEEMIAFMEWEKEQHGLNTLVEPANSCCTIL